MRESFALQRILTFFFSTKNNRVFAIFMFEILTNRLLMNNDVNFEQLGLNWCINFVKAYVSKFDLAVK